MQNQENNSVVFLENSLQEDCLTRAFPSDKVMEELFTASWWNELSPQVTDASESASSSTMVSAWFCLLGFYRIFRGVIPVSVI